MTIYTTTEYNTRAMVSRIITGMSTGLKGIQL